jgi:uncharacterized protein (TIGR03067 family)
MKKCAVLFVAVATLLIASTRRSGADEPARQLEGKWTVVAAVMNGVKATDRIAGRLSVTVRGNKLMLKPGLSVDGNGKVELGDSQGNEATFTLDPKTSPAQIDLTFGSGRNKIAVKGIYEIEKGELKICFSPKARPKDFANVAESGQTLLVAKRDKP